MKELANGKLKRKKDRREKYMLLKDLKQDFRKRETSAVSEVLTGAKVVFATCHG